MALPKDLNKFLEDNYIVNSDVVILGDGSGSKYGYAGGWACVLFDVELGTKRLFYGGINDTTVNIAELVPYVFALQWYSRGPGKELRKKKDATNEFAYINVDIITDCDIIVKQGMGKAMKDTNKMVWGAYDALTTAGYVINWHYIPRLTLSTNAYCDSVSKILRKCVEEVNEKLDNLVLPDLAESSFLD